MGDAVGKVDAPPSRLRFVRTCVALSLSLISTWLLNATAYPGFDGFFPEARDIATSFGALVAVALAFVALHRQDFFTTNLFMRGSFVAFVVGILVMLAGVRWENAALATVGACLSNLGSPVRLVYAGLALVGLSAPACLTVLGTSYLLKYAWMGALWFAPGAVKWAALAVLPVVSVLMLRPLVLPVFARIARAESPADLAITNPLSFLPFTNRMFVTILMFSAALGFVITYAAQDGNPTPFIYAAAPVAVVAMAVMVRRRTSPDALYGVAYVLVLAGLLLVSAAPSGTVAASSVANALLNAGSDVFSLVVWFMAASIGGRSPIAALPVLMAWRIASSLGTELGALSGHAVNGINDLAPALAPTFVAAVVLVFATYHFFTGRTFSFDRTLLGVEPFRAVVADDAPPGSGALSAGAAGPGAAGSVVAAGSSCVPDADRSGGPGGPAGSPIDRACAGLTEECGLTPREAQVLGLLARGRNVAYIQEELTLSRNTVKSYVASVYGKLGVHSHQELIDLVEGRGA